MDYTIVKTVAHDTMPVDIEFAWTYEDQPLADAFDDTEEQIAEMYEKINNYDLTWFVARVRVMYQNSELGSAYLGGNLYDDVEKAFEDRLGGHLDDMIDEAMEEAQAYAATMVGALKNFNPAHDV